MEAEKVLYEETGHIRDVNTVLVPLKKLRQLQLEAARYRFLRQPGSSVYMCWIDDDGAPEQLDASIDSAMKALM